MSTNPNIISRTRATPFSHWIRTGRWLPEQLADPALEVKFNPNHDPKDGRFTFKNDAGGGETRGRTSGSRRTATGKDARGPAKYDTYTVQAGDTLTHVAATRDGSKVSDLAQLNGLAPDAKLKVGQTLIVPTQAYLDRVRKGNDAANAIDVYLKTHGGHVPPNRAPYPTLAEQVYGPGTRQITVNGYTFTLDPQDRTEIVTGVLTSNPDQKRSRQAQASAGGSDRLPGDDGGHYIARRFNGPTEAFNHFAQDANFNRKDYAKLESDWARKLVKGEKVRVSIGSVYTNDSKRPDHIHVIYSVGGIRIERDFSNHTNAKRH